jgi:TPR repeat protein
MRLLKCLPLLLCLCCAYAEEITKEDVERYRELAEQGDALAQFKLGSFYYDGEGVPEDDAEAVMWFRKAAEQGHSGAQWFLGLCYANGEGVPEDDAEAAMWYRKVADQGVAVGQLFLGLCYANGEGVPEDDVKAYMWLNLASAQQGDEEIKRRKDVLTERMTREQIAEGQKMSREWLEKRENK